MSDAGQITVELVAKLDQLNSGLSEAVNSISGAAAEIRGSMEKMGDGGDKLREKTEKALDAGIFLEYEELAKQALEAVNKAFEVTAGKAMEFGLETSKFAAMMGSSTEHAAGLEAALKSVGVSLQEYENLAMRMEMRLKSQEGTFTALGMATRDQNGELLQGEAMMQSAIATMQQYKVGTDQNEFALQVFGRRAQDVYDIMRASKVEQQQYTDDMKALGVETNDTGQASVEMEAAIGRQKQQWLDLQIALGQKLMPVITQFMGFLNNEGRPVLAAFGTSVTFLVELLVGLGAIFLELNAIVGGAVAEIIDVIGNLAIVLKDLITLNWGALKTDFRDAMSDMESTFQKTLGRMKSIAEGTNAITDALQGKGKKVGSDENPFAHGGDKKFVQPNMQASAEDQALRNEILQNAEKQALEEVKIAQIKNEELLKLGRQTNDQFLETSRELEERKYAIQQDFLQKKLESDRRAAREAPAGTQGDSQRAKGRLEAQKDMDQLQTLAVQHQEALTAIEAKGAEAALKLHQQNTQQYIADENDRLANGIADIEEEYRAHLLSDNEKIASERSLTQTIYAEQLARLDSELSTLVKGTAQWNEAYKQRQKIAEEMHRSLRKIDNEEAAFSRKNWDTLTSGMRSSFNSALNGMLTGTMSWQSALGQIIDSIANGFLNMGEKILEDWIQTQVAKMIVDKTTSATSAIAQIQAAAGVAAANTFASISAIPVVGPELAPGAAAASMATVMSFQSLAFAEQGMLLDRDRLVFAHKDEQILPAHISKGMQSLIAGGGAGKGDTNLHYSPTVNAPQHKSLNQLLSDESSTMLSWLNARQRDGSLKQR